MQFQASALIMSSPKFWVSVRGGLSVGIWVLVIVFFFFPYIKGAVMSAESVDRICFVYVEQ